MTMYCLSEFCRICFQSDPHLIDIMKIENEPNETLLTKLKLCVSEVEWSSLKVLMCNSCIRRLNSSYEFKKQCIRSVTVLKSYTELLKESQIKSDLLIKGQSEDEGADSYVPLVPNQKIVKLIVPSTQASSFQNVFVNVLPPGGKTVQNNNVNGIIVQNSNTNGSDQAIFFNLNNIQKAMTGCEEADENNYQDINVSKILQESTTEELSIEIDPTDFDCASIDSPTNSEGQETEIKDWEEVITGTKILPVSQSSIPKIGQVPKGDDNDDDFNKVTTKYVPILPKVNFNQEISMEEKYEFFNSGHFLTSKEYPEVSTSTLCELCNKSFESKKLLRHHIKEFHCGKFPHLCEVCGKGFASQDSFKIHVQKHARGADNKNRESLTLQDFVSNNGNGNDLQNTPVSASTSMEILTDNDADDGGEHKCESCPRIFTSANGLLRHKVRKHKTKARKKYFIKGQKNARCDICNREFSTNSYMNMHKKLHLRHGADFKGKIFKVKSVDEMTKDDVKSMDYADIDNKDRNSDNTTDDFMDVAENITKNVLETINPIETIETSGNVENKMNNDGNKSDGCDEPDEDNKDADRAARENESTIQEVQLINIINIAPFHDFNSEQEELGFLKEFQNLGAFRTENSTQCIYCNKVFSRKHDLKRHLNNIHLKSIQFKCHLCNNTFYEAFHLTRHLRAHYSCASCTICQKMFSTETDMTQHNEMIHDNMALWQCGVCYVMFNEPPVLKQHMTEHQGPIIYRCHLCDDEFGESRDLSRHIIEHSGMYSCRICEKNFANEHEKTIHDTNTHGPAKKYDCDLCPKSYKKMHELTRHRNLHLLLLSQEKKNNEESKKD